MRVFNFNSRRDAAACVVAWGATAGDMSQGCALAPCYVPPPPTQYGRVCNHTHLGSLQRRLHIRQMLDEGCLLLAYVR